MYFNSRNSYWNVYFNSFFVKRGGSLGYFELCRHDHFAMFDNGGNYGFRCTSQENDMEENDSRWSFTIFDNNSSYNLAGIVFSLITKGSLADSGAGLFLFIVSGVLPVRLIILFEPPVSIVNIVTEMISTGFFIFILIQ